MKKLLTLITVMVVVFGTFSVYAADNFTVDEEMDDLSITETIDTLVINVPITGKLIVKKDAKVNNIIVDAKVDSIVIEGEVEKLILMEKQNLNSLLIICEEKVKLKNCSKVDIDSISNSLYYHPFKLISLIVCFAGLSCSMISLLILARNRRY